MNKSLINKPKHVAVIMDGNRRWAKQKSIPNLMGHKYGVKAAKQVVQTAIDYDIEILTLYAFSTENWRRPPREVTYIFKLLTKVLEQDHLELFKNDIQLLVIGDIKQLSVKLQTAINKMLDLTKNNNGLKLVIALNYGSRWDITQAAYRLAQQALVDPALLDVNQIDENLFNRYLVTDGLADPDLCIRAGGEKRLSNFLLWQMAYTELYFTEVLWPDFKRADFEQALNFYSNCQRRFGMTAEQILQQQECKLNA